MVTREQILDVAKKLRELEILIAYMQNICNIALLQYRVGGQTKTLPQTDIDALIQEYQKLKAELKTKVDNLP